MKNLKAWMRAATTEEQQTLADNARTTRTYLYHLANDTKSYGREPSPALAQRIERAAEKINAANPKLPRLLRTDMNSQCRDCDFALKCLGRDAILDSTFGIIDTTKETN